MKIAPMCHNYRAYIKVTSVVKFQYLVQYLVTTHFNHSYSSCTIKSFDGSCAKNDMEILHQYRFRKIAYSRVTERVMLNVGLK